MLNNRNNLPPEAIKLASKFTYDSSIFNNVPKLRYSHVADENSPNADLHVLGIAFDQNACGHYRLLYPLMNLAKQGANVEVIQAENLSCLDMNMVANSNYVIMSRLIDKEMFKAIKVLAERLNITLIYELDDCFHEIDAGNPASKVFNKTTQDGRYYMSSIEYAMKHSDGIIVSTRELAGFYEEYANKIHVVENGLDCSLNTRKWDVIPNNNWRYIAHDQGCEVNEDSLLIGWAGSPTHLTDLQEISTCIKTIIKNNPEVIFGIYSNDEFSMQVVTEVLRLPYERFMFIHPRLFVNYPEPLSYFDIGLAPLANNTFNRCKSALKLMEYNAQATPYVASNVAPYTRYHYDTECRGGLLANDVDDFTNCIQILINEPSMREQMQRGGMISARTQYDVVNTSKHLGYTLRLINENRLGITRYPSVIEMTDQMNGLPKPKKHIDPENDQCPCGSGDYYKYCRNQCRPAFG